MPTIKQTMEQYKPTPINNTSTNDTRRQPSTKQHDVDGNSGTRTSSAPSPSAIDKSRNNKNNELEDVRHIEYQQQRVDTNSNLRQ